MKKSTNSISRQSAIIFAVLSLVMTVVFAGIFFTNKSVEKTDVTKKVAVFNYYEEEYGPKIRRTVNSLDFLILFFENGENERIRGVCVNKELREDIEALQKGSELHMLINPNNDCIVELKTAEREILNFDYAQKKLRQEGVGFLYLAIFLLIICCYFIYHAITTKERITKADLKFYWDIMRKK